MHNFLVNNISVFQIFQDKIKTLRVFSNQIWWENTFLIKS